MPDFTSEIEPITDVSVGDLHVTEYARTRLVGSVRLALGHSFMGAMFAVHDNGMVPAPDWRAATIAGGIGSSLHGQARR